MINLMSTRQDLEVFEYRKCDLSAQDNQNVQKLIKRSFNRENDPDKHSFHSVIMLKVLENGVPDRLFGCMLVTNTPSMMYDFQDAFQCLNVTCLCVDESVRGKGLGKFMMNKFLESLCTGTVVFLHVDTKVLTGDDTMLTNRLVEWYQSMDFKIQYSNDVETAMYLYVNEPEMLCASDDCSCQDSYHDYLSDPDVDMDPSDDYDPRIWCQEYWLDRDSNWDPSLDVFDP